MRTCLCCKKQFKRTSVSKLCDRCALGWCDCPNRKLMDTLVIKSKKCRPAINRLIKMKIKKIGGEYLTEQGAIFLVAHDLGVKLS